MVLRMLVWLPRLFLLCCLGLLAAVFFPFGVPRRRQ